MRLPSLTILTAFAALVAGGAPLGAQAYSRLTGTWVMDSTNGPDDHGLPKSETLTFTPAAHGFDLTATEDDGQGPQTSKFSCVSTPSPSGSAGAESATECRLQPMRDSVRYMVDVRQNGKVVATERGRLVVSADGKQLRDQYDATEGTGAATHHRHIYNKQRG